MKLNLGCGEKKILGHVNVDRDPSVKPDVPHDLGHTPWPWPDGVVGEVVAVHVFEKLGPDPEIFLGAMRELYRVMRTGGLLKATLLHPRSDSFLADPTNVRPVLPQTFELFSARLNRERSARGEVFTLLASRLGVDFELDELSYEFQPQWAIAHRNGMSRGELEHAMRTNWNVVDKFSVIVRRG